MSKELRSKVADCISSDGKSEGPNGQGILGAFKQLSEQLPWLIINLAAVSNQYTSQVLCEKLKVYEELEYIYEVISIIQEITKLASPEKQTQFTLSD